MLRGFYLFTLKANTMTKIRKPTRKLFCEIYDEARKMRRTDPIQFEIMYHEWKRRRQGNIN